MLQSTRLLFQLLLAATPATGLVLLLTVSYYNLHKYAGQLAFRSPGAFLRPLFGTPIRPLDRFLFLLAVLAAPWLCWQCGWTITLLAAAMALVSLAYLCAGDPAGGP